MRFFDASVLAAAIGLVLVHAHEPVSKPNIIFYLADDLGVNSAWRNDEHVTPHMDQLVEEEALELTSVYTYKFCGPSRACLLTGRYPYKHASTRCNFIPSTSPEGVDIGYRLIPHKLADAGYVSHHVGKWHLGFHRDEYTPVGRGFNTSYGFLTGGTNHYDHITSSPEVNCHFDWPYDEQGSWDFWSQATDNFPGAPEPGQGLGPECKNDTTHSGDDSAYLGYLHTARAVKLIEDHGSNSADASLFMYFAIHNTHAALQAPERFIELYPYEWWWEKQVWSAMVSVIDESVANMTRALKDTGMWDNTLFVYSTDNGSPVQVGGSNFPLRGGKGSNFNGGVLVPTFVSGGVLPALQRGKSLPGLVHFVDFYETFVALAGLPSGNDPDAPSPSDSIDMWPYFSGVVSASPRSEVVLDHYMFTNESSANSCNGQEVWEVEGFNALGALIVGDMKLLVGSQPYASWYSDGADRFSPNSSATVENVHACVDSPCLFNITEDPAEHVDLASHLPDVVATMLTRFADFEAEVHPSVVSPPREDDSFCAVAADFGGFAAPYFNDRPTLP